MLVLSLRLLYTDHIAKLQRFEWFSSILLHTLILLILVQDFVQMQMLRNIYRIFSKKIYLKIFQHFFSFPALINSSLLVTAFSLY